PQGANFREQPAAVPASIVLQSPADEAPQRVGVDAAHVEVQNAGAGFGEVVLPQVDVLKRGVRLQRDALAAKAHAAFEIAVALPAAEVAVGGLIDPVELGEPRRLEPIELQARDGGVVVEPVVVVEVSAQHAAVDPAGLSEAVQLQAGALVAAKE